MCANLTKAFTKEEIARWFNGYRQKVYGLPSRTRNDPFPNREGTRLSKRVCEEELQRVLAN